MIIPSIDIEAGRTVQLVGGEELAIDAGDPTPLLDSFSQVGEVAVIDLDAAKGEGENRALIEGLARRARVRVGGGIRDLETARRWLDHGASKIILGTAARPDLLTQLPKERLIAAVDGRDGEVVVEGWRTKTGEDVTTRIRELRDHVWGFLVTFVEREGRLTGIDFDRVRELADACGDARLCVAGGIRSAEEIGQLAALGVDAQVGMALYKGDLDLAASVYASCSVEREDGLVPTLVCDELGAAMGLAWSNEESLREALSTRTGVYHSRRRGLWRKGESSGATQDLLRVSLDCDRDALRFLVRQRGAGFCHEDTRTCFGDDLGPGALERRVQDRLENPVEGSYVHRLANEDGLLDAKIVEEARELVEATTRDEVVHEAADLLFFLQAKLTTSGLRLEDVLRELELRSRKVKRRGGDRKVAPDDDGGTR